MFALGKPRCPQWLVTAEEMEWLRSMQLADGGPPLSEDSMDFTDMLFSGIYTPPQTYPFPNPREIGKPILTNNEGGV